MPGRTRNDRRREVAGGGEVSANIITGDCLEVLRTLDSESVQACITSPPYWGLRDYGVVGQIGLEKSMQEYIKKIVSVFDEVRRVLKSDGTLWLNLGDSYANDGKWRGETGGKQDYLPDNDRKRVGREKRKSGLKPKDLCMVPHRVAIALQNAGWWVRQDIVWSKPNPMPESVRDRCTKAHEYIFLLSKSERYLYDRDAIAEDSVSGDTRKPYAPGQVDARGSGHDRGGGSVRDADGDTRNKRSVWTIPTIGFPEAHFATFPPALIEPCVLAGSREGDLVLDPFSGAGTTGLVALAKGRRYLGIELNPEYAEMSRKRIKADSPLFNEVEVSA